MPKRVSSIVDANDVEHTGDYTVCPTFERFGHCHFCLRLQAYPVEGAGGRGKAPNGQAPMRLAGREPKELGHQMVRYLDRDTLEVKDRDGAVIGTRRIAPSRDPELEMEILRDRYPHYYETLIAHLEGDSSDDIAVRFNITAANARMRRERAMRKLDDLIAENDRIRGRQRRDSEPEILALGQAKEGD